MKTIVYRNHQITVRPSSTIDGHPEFIANNYCLPVFVVQRGATENEALEKAKAALDIEIEKTKKS